MTNLTQSVFLFLKIKYENKILMLNKKQNQFISWYEKQKKIDIILPGITLSNDARTITLAANAASVSVAPGINMIQIYICVYVYV